jgi:hypothetical protein
VLARRLGPCNGGAQRGNLRICRARDEQASRGRFQRRANLVDLPRLVRRHRGDREHSAPAAYDQVFGLQRLQRRANARTADVEAVHHLAFHEPRSGLEAKREDGFPQSLRAALSQGVPSRVHDASIAYAR